MKRLLPWVAASLLSISSVSVADDSLKPAAWVPLPAVGSSPETGFQYGAYVMRIFPQTEIGVPQNRLEVLLQGTANGQFQAYLWPNLYFDGGRLQIKGQLGGRYWPSGYFGQGNTTAESADKYSDTALEGSITINRKLSPEWALGVKIFGEQHSLADIDEEPSSTLLVTEDRDLSGGFFSGAGANAILDTRDSLDWPTNGYHLLASIDAYTSLLGSSETFTRLLARGARYWSVSEDVVALAAEFQGATDTTPFYYLPKPNGGNTLRGANGNRWIDQHGLGLQGEYRMTLSPRWAAVAFADSYQVAGTLSDISLQNMHTSVGGGIRFATTPDRFNIRLDVGWVDFESIGFTISVGEAF